MFFKRKELAETFGLLLHEDFGHTITKAIDYLKKPNEYSITWPDNAYSEICAILFVAFDIAIYLGPETEIRNRIRDSFYNANPKAPWIAVLGKQVSQYAEAIDKECYFGLHDYIK